MLAIGIETSGIQGSVALRQDGTCLSLRTLDHAGRRHAQSLLLELKSILLEHRVTPRDVNTIAVSSGPGSFTGLRVGMVCAKTFAYATGCRFVAVDTFAAVAMNCPPELNDVWIAEDAQRGELFVGHYRRDSHQTWVRENSIDVVDAPQWLSSRLTTDTLVGRGLARCDLSLTKANCLTSDKFTVPLASNVALKGEQMLADPDPCDPASFDCWRAVPFYLRKSAAEERRSEPDTPKVTN